MALKNDDRQRHGHPGGGFPLCGRGCAGRSPRDQPGWEDLRAPINKQGAHFFLNQNSREPVTEPDEMVPLWKILHRPARTGHTAPKDGRRKLLHVLADDEGWEQSSAIQRQGRDDLGCKVLAEHGVRALELFAVRVGLQKFKIPHNFEIKSMMQYYAQWIREGKLKVNSDWNKDLEGQIHRPGSLPAGPKELG